jgi:Ca2+-binding EF-hand superfamily protein
MLIRKSAIGLLVALGAVAMAGQAAAQAAPKVDDAFKVLDKNGDGYIDREEAKADPSVDKRFTEIDKDADGKISREEMAAAMKK